MARFPAVISRTELSNTFLGDVVQICIVTRDYRRTLQGLVKLGIGPWRIRTFDRSNLTDTMFRGSRTEFAMKVCLADAQNMNWEVIEPLQGPSIYTDFLEHHGEGIQHIGVDCGGATYEEKLRHFRERGYEPIQSGIYAGGVRFHYFATEDDTKTIFEVFDVPAGFVFPPPEEWFPGPLPT